MGSLSDNVWSKYAEGIQAGASKGDAVYFIASTVKKAPAANSSVPDASVNYALYRLCDALITDDNPAYNPSTGESYFKNVAKYLRAALPGSSRDPGLQERYIMAQRDLEAAQANYEKVAGAAADRYAKDPMAEGMPFDQWVMMMYPPLSSAQREREQRGEMLRATLNQTFGADASQLSGQQDACWGASNISRNIPGLNMECAVRQDSPVRLYKPAYSIDPSFKQNIDAWAQASGGSPTFTSNIKSSDIQRGDWTKFGHKSDVDGFKVGFIRTRGDPSSDWQDSNVINEPGSFEIEVTASKVGLFNVAPGNWNVKNLKRAYPNTSGDVGAAARAVSPAQLFCASGAKLRIKFSGAMDSAFDRVVNDVRNGGSVNILGFSVGGGESEVTHTSDWNKSDGWYEIKPTSDAGACTVLAVLGDKA